MAPPGLDETSTDDPASEGSITARISAAIIDLYRDNYGHDRTTATTYINDKVVVCLLENILSADESEKVSDGGGEEVIIGRLKFQDRTEEDFTEVVERITGSSVLAFLSANETTPGVACELFFLDERPAEAR